MTFSARLASAGLLFCCCAILSGCVPSGHGETDEEREPHFLAGKRRFTEMDYKGAVEAFEKALEVNPNSAMAHLELGCLFDSEKVDADPVAAIYHYQKYLKLRPRAENAEIINQHILACKQELAESVSLGPVTEKQQREFEQLNEDNRRLRDEVEKWRAYCGTRQSAQTNVSTCAVPPAKIVSTSAVASATPASHPAPPAAAHTHTILAGETPTRIARKYGVKVEVLMAANPGLDARKLQPGQSLNIPSP